MGTEYFPSFSLKNRVVISARSMESDSLVSTLSRRKWRIRSFMPGYDELSSAEMAESGSFSIIWFFTRIAKS